ncbi:MAG TPA: hypothetical protein DIC51_02440 [Coxiellaceae bacterium]|nr:hypothetical protein [Coxiellaceae bacterium]
MQGYLFALSAGILWGLVGFFSKTLNHYTTAATTIACYRLFIAFFGFFIIYSIKDRKILFLKKAEWIPSLILGFFCQTIVNGALFKSIALTGSITGLILLCTGPIFTAAFSYIFFKEKLSLYTILSVMLTFFGVFLILTDGAMSFLNKSIMGIAYGFASGIFFGLFPVLMRIFMLKGLNPIALLAYSLFFGGIFLFPYVGLHDASIIFTNYHILLYLLLIGFVSTTIADYLFISSLNYLSATKVSLLTLIEIPFIAIVGIFLLKEKLFFYQLLGMLLFLIGVVFNKFTVAEQKGEKS